MYFAFCCIFCHIPNNPKNAIREVKPTIRELKPTIRKMAFARPSFCPYLCNKQYKKILPITNPLIIIFIMANSYSEQTHGAELRRLQKMNNLIASFTNFNPPHPDDTIAQMQILEQALVQANIDEATQKATYQISVNQRQQAFFHADFSLTKILKYLSAVVLATYSSRDKEYLIVKSQIRKIRGAAPVAKSVVGAAATATIEKVSQSHRSYASLTLAFSDLVQILSTLQYAPNRPELQIPQLQNFVTQLTTLSNTAEINLSELNRLRLKRDELFAEVPVRLKRLKNYIRFQYGDTSYEYTEAKKI